MINGQSIGALELVANQTASNLNSSSSDTGTNPDTYTLDASNSTATIVYLVAHSATNTTSADNSTSSGTTSSGSSQSSDIPVTLQMPVFQPSTAEDEQYCANMFKFIFHFVMNDS